MPLGYYQTLDGLLGETNVQTAKGDTATSALAAGLESYSSSGCSHGRLTLKIGNYRPVSLESALCKVLQGIIRGKRCRHLMHHRMLHSGQHGVLQHLSYLANLKRFLNKATLRLNENKPAEVSYLNVSKACDFVTYPLPSRICESLA